VGAVSDRRVELFFSIRCLVVAEHAVDVGRERAFVEATSRAIWGEAVEVARDRGLRTVCERAGLEWEACRAALQDPALRARVEANTDALAALGHWGVPVLVYRGEQFWGQDRIEDLEVVLRSTATRGPR
jgi:2-hydroxychromene-2-carboxylate isomerase